MLADFHNVEAAEPGLGRGLHEQQGEVRHDPRGVLAGFQHLQTSQDAGYLNEDFASATFNEGLEAVATGKAAQYPMITFGIPAISRCRAGQRRRRRLLRHAG